MSAFGHRDDHVPRSMMIGSFHLTTGWSLARQGKTRQPRMV
jgi:hypothetical protein